MSKYNASDNTEIDILEGELRLIREKKLEGSLIRSRATWVKEGEKPSKYFCNLENRNYVSKSVRSLIVDGTVIDKEEDIVNSVKTFYEELYRSRDNTLKDINLDSLLQKDTPKLMAGLLLGVCMCGGV